MDKDPTNTEITYNPTLTTVSQATEDKGQTTQVTTTRATVIITMDRGTAKDIPIKAI
jgi:hypothetical protein